MGLKSDNWIRKMSDRYGMIEPFEGGLMKHNQNGESVISYGTSSYGYDIRIDDQFKIFHNINSTSVIDPKSFKDECCQDFKGKECIIPPHGFVLACSMEYMRIPKDVLAICLGKSTYARCGVIVNVTPLEPGWEGIITLELSNTTPLPVKVYAHEGVAQLLFFQGDEACHASYKDRMGKYQGQRDITLPKVV